MTGSRRRARQAVLQALYWSESSGDSVRQTVHTMAIRTGLSSDAAGLAEALGRCTWDHREDMDRLIESVLENWDLDRIARVDRILLRMALTEIRHFPDIPVKVSIDEAIELAKAFSEEKASAFINGILDALVKRGDLEA